MPTSSNASVDDQFLTVGDLKGLADDLSIVVAVGSTEGNPVGWPLRCRKDVSFGAGFVVLSVDHAAEPARVTA